jgi:ABC-type multidrug transport system fused ATPase/permease subunit
MEMSYNSVERCHEYLGIEEEAPEVVEGSRPPVHWPAEGRISIRELEMRYNAEGEAVLHKISAEIGATEKVGIVGRTGEFFFTVRLVSRFRITSCGLFCHYNLVVMVVMVVVVC